MIKPLENHESWKEYREHSVFDANDDGVVFIEVNDVVRVARTPHDRYDYQDDGAYLDDLWHYLRENLEVRRFGVCSGCLELMSDNEFLSDIDEVFETQPITPKYCATCGEYYRGGGGEVDLLVLPEKTESDYKTFQFIGVENIEEE